MIIFGFAFAILFAFAIRELLDTFKASRSKDDELVERLRRWGL